MPACERSAPRTLPTAGSSSTSSTCPVGWSTAAHASAGPKASATASASATHRARSRSEVQRLEQLAQAAQPHALTDLDSTRSRVDHVAPLQPQLAHPRLQPAHVGRAEPELYLDGDELALQ